MLQFINIKKTSTNNWIKVDYNNFDKCSNTYNKHNVQQNCFDKF